MKSHITFHMKRPEFLI